MYIDIYNVDMHYPIWYFTKPTTKYGPRQHFIQFHFRYFVEKNMLYKLYFIVYWFRWKEMKDMFCCYVTQIRTLRCKICKEYWYITFSIGGHVCEEMRLFSITMQTKLMLLLHHKLAQVQSVLPRNSMGTL